MGPSASSGSREWQSLLLFLSAFMVMMIGASISWIAWTFQAEARVVVLEQGQIQAKEQDTESAKAIQKLGDRMDARMERMESKLDQVVRESRR